MTSSIVQLKVEEFIRTHVLPEKYGLPFYHKELKLNSGGQFSFDAVSKDGTIVANISTSTGKTATGKYPSAKVQKLRADMLFLLLTETKHRLIVLTEKDMFDLCKREKEAGRTPVEINFLLAEIPEVLREELQKSRKIASDEVTPLKGVICYR